MKRNSFRLFLLSLLAPVLISLSSCESVAPSREREAKDISIHIDESASSPLISAQVYDEGGTLSIRGQVHRKEGVPMNGVVSLSLISPAGKLLWHKDSELAAAGLRFFRYRYFEERSIALPPPGSTLRVEFRPGPAT